MKKRSYNISKQKNIFITSLLAIVLIMAVGYAAFATNLTVNGTASISSNWCIGFDSTKTTDYVASKTHSTGDTPTGSISFSGNACQTNYKTNASLVANFKQPGDKVVYTLTIANKGSLAAAIESILVDNNNVTSNQTITKGNVKYTIEMPLDTSLAVNETTTMQITAEFQNDTNISSSSTSTETISVQINATQDDGSGGFTPTSAAQTVYAINESSIYKNTSTLQDIGTTYNSCSATGKNTCIRYTIENDIVTGAEACFIKGGTEYCLKGWVDESSLETTPVYNANKTTLQTAFTETNACSDYGYHFSCYASGFDAGGSNEGDVHALGGYWVCCVYSVGRASCSNSY